MEADAGHLYVTAPPLAAYSSARVVSITPDVHFLYISGTTARQDDGTIPPFEDGYDDYVANDNPHDELTAAGFQTAIIIKKIDAVINNISVDPVGLEALVELTIFVKDLKRDYAAINEIYNERVGTRLRSKGVPLPARTCVEVKGMPPDERTLVEIKAVAKVGRIRNN